MSSAVCEARRTSYLRQQQRRHLGGCPRLSCLIRRTENGFGLLRTCHFGSSCCPPGAPDAHATLKLRPFDWHGSASRCSDAPGPRRARLEEGRKFVPYSCLKHRPEPVVSGQ